jgi:ParB family chromosome partitioning protein
MKRQALGRGLSALLSEDFQEVRDQLMELDVDSLSPNNRQPRSHFDEAALADLARSIQANGILQPIVARRDGQRYEIVAGERRWRAAKSLGLKKIPAVVREFPPQKMLEAALVENLQRENLNAMEEARAYEWLIQDFGLSQEEVATRVGKDRSTITNMLRLLKLPPEVQALVVDGKLGPGHARALLSVGAADKMKELAERVTREGLSVRQVEEMVRVPAPGERAAPATAEKAKVAKDVHDRAAERKLEQRLGTRVVIRRARRGGRIEVAFYSEEELQRLFEILTDAD